MSVYDHIYIVKLEAKIEEAKRLMEIAMPTLLTVFRDNPMPSNRQLPVLIRQMQSWLGWLEQALAEEGS